MPAPAPITKQTGVTFGPSSIELRIVTDPGVHETPCSRWQYGRVDRSAPGSGGEDIGRSSSPRRRVTFGGLSMSPETATKVRLTSSAHGRKLPPPALPRFARTPSTVRPVVAVHETLEANRCAVFYPVVGVGLSG